MLNEPLSLMLALLTGVLLGLIFFGGLWWTVRRGVSSNWPALLFCCSLIIRVGITLAGFYLISSGHWERLVSCLIGFLMMRFSLVRNAQAGLKSAYLAARGNHAP